MIDRPDFARTESSALARQDLRFLIDNFPAPGRDMAEIARLIQHLPTTLESMLESDFVFDSLMRKREGWVEVSPFLLFNVLLRRSLEGRRTQEDRRVINYLANILSLFVHAERLYRVQPCEENSFEYLVDLVAEGARSDERRRFLCHVHIGNFSLYLAGVHRAWIEHRHRYRRRPVTPAYYRDMGRSYFSTAARHPRAQQLGLQQVFAQLACRFEEYQDALNRLSCQYLAA
jgi:hypothetical protein